MQRYSLPILAILLVAALAYARPGGQPAPNGTYEVRTTGSSDMSKETLEVLPAGATHGLPEFKKPTSVKIDGDVIPANGWSWDYDEATHKLSIKFNVPYVPGNGADVRINGPTEDSSHDCKNFGDAPNNDLGTSWT